MTLSPAKSFPRIIDIPFTGRDACSPTATMPEIMSECRLIKCKGTLITPISTPCSSTLMPTEDWSENGRTLSRINDWVAPVSLSTLIGTFSLLPSKQTNPLAFDTNGNRYFLGLTTSLEPWFHPLSQLCLGPFVLLLSLALLFYSSSLKLYILTSHGPSYYNSSRLDLMEIVGFAGLGVTWSARPDTWELLPLPGEMILELLLTAERSPDCLNTGVWVKA